MRYLIFWGLFFCLSFESTSSVVIKNATEIKARKTEENSIKLKPFTSLNISGPYEVELLFSNKNEIIIDANKEERDKSLIVSKGKELAISYEGKDDINKLIKITIYTESLREIELAGKTELFAPETMEGRILNIVVAEHASCYLDLEYENIKCELSGAAQVEFSGRCNQLSIETADAAYMEGNELHAERVVLKAKGATSTKLHATDYLKITASNAANIVYSGKAKQKDIKTEGSVRVEATP